MCGVKISARLFPPLGYTEKKGRKSGRSEVGGGITKTQHVSGGIPLLREREGERATGVGVKGARKARGRKEKRGKV